MLEALAFVLVVVALGLPGLVVAMFGSALTSDLPADRHTAASVEPKQAAKSAFFEVMSPPPLAQRGRIRVDDVFHAKLREKWTPAFDRPMTSGVRI